MVTMAGAKRWHLVVWAVILIAIIAVLGWYLYEMDKVELRDAYCEENGPFRFTLVNNRDETVHLEYEWTLNDPEADEPVFKGDGEVDLGSMESQTIVVDINNTRGYDCRFLVMYVDVYKDGEQVIDYRQQKSTYDWDYSKTPPVQVKDFDHTRDMGKWLPVILLLVVFVIVLVAGLWLLVIRPRRRGRERPGSPPIRPSSP